MGNKLGRIFASEGAALDVGLEEGIKVTGQVLVGGTYVGGDVPCRVVLTGLMSLNGGGGSRGYRT